MPSLTIPRRQKRQKETWRCHRRRHREPVPAPSPRRETERPVVAYARALAARCKRIRNISWKGPPSVDSPPSSVSLHTGLPTLQRQRLHVQPPLRPRQQTVSHLHRPQRRIRPPPHLISRRASQPSNTRSSKRSLRSTPIPVQLPPPPRQRWRLRYHCQTSYRLHASSLCSRAGHLALQSLCTSTSPPPIPAARLPSPPSHTRPRACGVSRQTPSCASLRGPSTRHSPAGRSARSHRAWGCERTRRSAWRTI